MNKGVEQMLRLSSISRWQIVETLKPQSVAEHSYRTWILARDLYNAMEDVNHNSFEQDSVFLWALEHDVEEVASGDIPSTVKDVLEELSPGITDKLKERLLNDMGLQTVASKMRVLKNTYSATIVKIADIVESVIFIKRYALHPTDSSRVRGHLNNKLTEVFHTAHTRFPTVNWDRAYDWIRKVYAEYE